MNFNSPAISPIESAERWFAHAIAENTTQNPLSMVLSTVDQNGHPSSRVVLLKGFDERGAVFFTNYKSSKAEEMASHDMVSLLFHWDDSHRQLRIQGRVTKVAEDESDAYFATRPRLSQIGAWASKQSEPLNSRTVLIAKVAALTAKWIGRSVPRPQFWGGYRVSIDTIEFWQGHDGRLHDRIRYVHNDGWSWLRLQP